MSYAIEVQRVGARLVAWDGKATAGRGKFTPIFTDFSPQRSQTV